MTSLSFVYAQPSQDVFMRLQEYKLTKYTNWSDFRPNDYITRGESSKFMTQYAQALDITSSKRDWCNFNDIDSYDISLKPFIIQSCQLGLFQWYKGMFMPHNSITKAQALAITIRALNGYQDETKSPWYKEYYTIGKEIGLTLTDNFNTLDSTAITREEFAKRLYQSFNYSNQWYVYETPVDSAAECTSREEYDATRKVCYYTCKDEKSCQQIQSQIDKELESYTDILEDTERNHVEDSFNTDKTSKAFYWVSSWEIITFQKGNNLSAYTTIWNSIAELSPDTLSNWFIESFEVYDDPNNDTIAFVEDEDINGKWKVAINLAIYNNIDEKEKKVTLIHELSHIITLNNSQMLSLTTCPNYNTEEWCTKENSYLNHFYQRFRSSIKGAPTFEKNKFVTDYATTNVEEDIAESFAFFVLDSTHNNHSIKNQKKNFFNNYPELITMRKEMRNVLTKDIIE